MTQRFVIVEESPRGREDRPSKSLRVSRSRCQHRWRTVPGPNARTLLLSVIERFHVRQSDRIADEIGRMTDGAPAPAVPDGMILTQGR